MFLFVHRETIFLEMRYQQSHLTKNENMTSLDIRLLISKSVYFHFKLNENPDISFLRKLNFGVQIRTSYSILRSHFLLCITGRMLTDGRHPSDLTGLGCSYLPDA